MFVLFGAKTKFIKNRLIPKVGREFLVSEMLRYLKSCNSKKNTFHENHKVCCFFVLSCYNNKLHNQTLTLLADRGRFQNFDSKILYLFEFI